MPIIKKNVMTIQNILTFILLCNIMPHAYTMELVSLEETEPINFIIDYDCPFFKLPGELVDRIIFSCPPETIGVLKNSCRYLASLASLLRIKDQTVRYFTIPDEEARLDLFKSI